MTTAGLVARFSVAATAPGELASPKASAAIKRNDETQAEHRMQRIFRNGMVAKKGRCREENILSWGAKALRKAGSGPEGLRTGPAKPQRLSAPFIVRHSNRPISPGRW